MPLLRGGALASHWRALAATSGGSRFAAAEQQKLWAQYDRLGATVACNVTAAEGELAISHDLLIPGQLAASSARSGIHKREREHPQHHLEPLHGSNLFSMARQVAATGQNPSGIRTASLRHLE